MRFFWELNPGLPGVLIAILQNHLNACTHSTHCLLVYTCILFFLAERGAKI